MAVIDILKQIEFGELTEEQKTELTKLLRKYRRDLRKALAAVEQGLQQVAPATPPSGGKRK